jgi:hypothetical protein
VCKTIIASFGAIVTILALATEPFTQQILAYDTLSTPADNVTASISTSKSFGYNSKRGSLYSALDNKLNMI